jgi:hypothetical protein
MDQKATFSGNVHGDFDISAMKDTLLEIQQSSEIQGARVDLNDSVHLTMDPSSKLLMKRGVHMSGSSMTTVAHQVAIEAHQLFLTRQATIYGRGSGYEGCEGPGSPSRSERGGSHGGLGSREDVDAFVNAENSLLAYDDVFRPSLPGSGGCDREKDDRAGHGGAYLHLEVSGRTRLEGEIDLSGGDALEPPYYDEG